MEIENKLWTFPSQKILQKAAGPSNAVLKSTSPCSVSGLYARLRHLLATINVISKHHFPFMPVITITIIKGKGNLIADARTTFCFATNIEILHCSSGSHSGSRSSIWCSHYCKSTVLKDVSSIIPVDNCTNKSNFTNSRNIIKISTPRKPGFISFT